MKKQDKKQITKQLIADKNSLLASRSANKAAMDFRPETILEKDKQQYNISKKEIDKKIALIDGILNNTQKKHSGVVEEGNVILVHFHETLNGDITKDFTTIEYIINSKERFYGRKIGDKIRTGEKFDRQGESCPDKKNLFKEWTIIDIL